MKVYHIVPKFDIEKHSISDKCWCHPSLRDKKEAGVDNCWQHNHSLGEAHPVMVSGMMYAAGWTLFSAEEKDNLSGGGESRPAAIGSPNAYTVKTAGVKVGGNQP